MVATTVLVASDITETDREPVFVTNIAPLVGSYATPVGLVATGMVATTVLVASEITEAELEIAFVTNISPLAGS